MICRWLGVEAVKMSSSPLPPKRATCELQPAAIPATRNTAAPCDKLRPLRFKTLELHGTDPHIPETQLA